MTEIQYKDNNNKSFQKRHGLQQFYPMQIKVLTKQETKEIHLKKLLQLSLKSARKLEFKVDGSVWKDGKPIVDEPSDEQKVLVIRKMKVPQRAWEVWDQ